MTNLELYSKELFKNGFVHLKGLLDNNEISLLNRSIDLVYKNPTPFRIKKKTNDGEFFMDYNNWRRIPEVEKLCKSKKIASIASNLVGSKNCWLMHEDVLVKSGTDGAPTPIHHDRPYFIFKGKLNLSIWMTGVDVKRDSSLICYKGSHLNNKIFLPKLFTSGKNASEFKGLESNDFEQIEDDTFREDDLVDFDLKAGDGVAFFHNTIHGSHMHKDKSNPRKSLVIRYLMDGASLTTKYYNNVPPYDKMGVNIKEDGEIPEDFFPKLIG